MLILLKDKIHSTTYAFIIIVLGRLMVQKIIISSDKGAWPVNPGIHYSYWLMLLEKQFFWTSIISSSPLNRGDTLLFGIILKKVKTLKYFYSIKIFSEFWD